MGNFVLGLCKIVSVTDEIIMLKQLSSQKLQN